MGHSRLPDLIMTKRWKAVVALIGGNANAAKIAAGTLHACETELRSAANDTGVIETVWLLMQIPFAARSDDFTEALRQLGMEVCDEPGLCELISTFTEAIDNKMPNNRGRTDLGENAQYAAAETLVARLASETKALFSEVEPDQVRAEMARQATVKNFGELARLFFHRFLNRTINSQLHRVLSDQLGADHRFHTLGQQRDFTDSLDKHCQETTKIVETYAGEWLSKNRFESGGEIDRDMVQKFIGYAMTKLMSELRRRNTSNGK